MTKYLMHLDSVFKGIIKGFIEFIQERTQS